MFKRSYPNSYVFTKEVIRKTENLVNRKCFEVHRYLRCCPFPNRPAYYDSEILYEDWEGFLCQDGPCHDPRDYNPGKLKIPLNEARQIVAGFHFKDREQYYEWHSSLCNIGAWHCSFRISAKRNEFFFTEEQIFLTQLLIDSGVLNVSNPHFLPRDLNDYFIKDWPYNDWDYFLGNDITYGLMSYLGLGYDTAEQIENKCLKKINSDI